MEPDFKPTSIYASFDTFPAAKGAAVHIREFSQTLFNFAGNGLLLSLGSDLLPSWQIEGNIEVRRLVSEEPNFLKRTIEFSSFVFEHGYMLRENLKIGQFRDPWSGIPLLDIEERNFPLIYEVNGLPSIELPSRYPGIAPGTLEKIRQVEKRCWNEADSIVCPSDVIKNCLIDLGAESNKINVIRNGAHKPGIGPMLLPDDQPDNYLIYFGAVQPWQGVETIFKTLKYLKDFSDLKVVLCVSGSKPRLKYLRKLAERMEVSDRLIWKYKISQEELMPWIMGARISLAPLVECSRNLVQGCCPMKIIESMALSVPVIASDIPVVRELVEHSKTGWLVRPDRPAELARAIRILLTNSTLAKEIGNNGKIKFENFFTWDQAKENLKDVYRATLNDFKK